MLVDKGFNLYVDVTAACNASCPFCIAPTVGRKDGLGFIEGLRWALDFTQDHYGSVQVTGGEPTMSRRLPEVVREIARRAFHRVVLNTNGCGIAKPGTVIDLEAAGFTHVNLSRHHYRKELNQAIMHIKPDAISENHEFVRAVQLVLQSGMMARINCNLLAGYIDSAEKMFAFVDWCETFGAFSVAFAETFPLGVFDHQVPIVPGYAESHTVDLSGIVAELDSILVPQPNGGSSLMSVWGGSSGWGGVSSTLPTHRRFWKTPSGGQISVKTLAGWNEDGSPKPPSYSRADDPELKDGELYFAVVHPDGVVTGSWDKRERILFAPAKTELVSIPLAYVGVR